VLSNLRVEAVAQEIKHRDALDSVAAVALATMTVIAADNPSNRAGE
jgi:hypothetical protein